MSEGTQDFSRRFAVVIRGDLPSWQAMNALAHISAYLGNRLREGFDTGEHFETKDGLKHPRNTQYPIVVLRAAANDLQNFATGVRASGLPYLGFIREMIETPDDLYIANALAGKLDSAVEYLGIGVFGPNDVVKPLTKKFALWK